MSSSAKSGTAAFAEHISQGSIFLASLDELGNHSILLPYAHYVAQAWNKLNLTGVLCVDGRPTIYICEGQSFDVKTKHATQQFAWNQGLTPLLVFLTRTAVEVYSTLRKPVEIPTDGLFEAELPSLIPQLRDLTEALECAKFVRSVETGQFFQDNAPFFPANETVDYCLVENLSHSAKKLAATGDDWDLQRAYALLGRILFVSFLQEREFIKPDYYPNGASSLLDLLTSGNVADRKSRLYDEFFERLRVEFNGTMFDTELVAEKRRVRSVHLDIVAGFLSGSDMRTGQMTLGFWAYDFRVIPVETISAIYEEFLNIDPDKRRSDGAYYTPRHLAETTLHVALEGRFNEAPNWKILDPACGSGIFLVAMFNLISEQWLRGNPQCRKKTKAQALLDILLNQIRGIDTNPDACRITAFSLYLALFEKLRPTDVDEFKANVRHDRFLPPLLATADGEPNESPVISSCSFLEGNQFDRDFNLVVGNPPWDSRGDKQIALHFAKRSREYLGTNGIGCLILPTTILVNLHGTLDAEWFQSVTVERIVQLADFRRLLFDATHACFIMRYRKTPPLLDSEVQYETPKLNRFDRRRGIIVVEPDDHKLVPLRDIVEAGIRDRLQSVWSRKFWGTARDEQFLRRLDSLPSLHNLVSLVGDHGAKKRWVGGVGFKPHYPGVSSGEPKPVAPWELSSSYIANDRRFPAMVLLPEDCTTLGKGLLAAKTRFGNSSIQASLTELHRKPSDEIFQPPMVLMSRGFTKFAFSGYKLRFRHSLHSIAGSSDDEDLLRFLTAVLGSRMMRYIAFHSGSSNGIGRSQFHLFESLNLPFPLPSDDLARSDAAEIVRQAATIHRKFEQSIKGKTREQRSKLIGVAISDLEPLINSYYRVSDSEWVLIEDTLEVFRPSIHRPNLDASIPALRFPDEHDRKRYANTLVQSLERCTQRGTSRFHVEGMASEELNLVLVIVHFSGHHGAYSEAGSDPELWEMLKKLQSAAKHRQGTFSYLRGFSFFDHDRLYILKPATLRNWCRTAALNDADTIFEYLNSRAE